MPETQSPDPVAPAYNVALFAQSAQKPAPSVNVHAPIVLDARTNEGVRSFLDFFSDLGKHKNTEVAEAEGRRIRPYLSTMSLYLTRALQKLDPKSELGQKKDALARITTPQGLSEVFNAMAAFTRITMTSDVVVMADNIQKTGPASHLFSSWNEFKTGYNYCGRWFNFGFLQTFEGGSKKNAKSGTTFPTFMIDHEMVDALPQDKAAPLVRGLQSAMTAVNHDMLHHFTSTVINAQTVFSGGEDRWENSSNPVYKWYEKIPSVSFGEAYEDWAQMGQQEIMVQPGGTALADEVRATLDSYFDALDGIGRDLLATADGAPPSGGQLQKAHEVVDYFGMVMAHALTRAFPLNHPTLQYCLDRLEKADPLPAQALRDCSKMMAKEPLGEVADAGFEKVLLLNSIRRSSSIKEHLLPEMIKSYRELGCEVFPDDDDAVGYKHLKMLQLMKLGGLHTHIPAIGNDRLMKIRNNMDELTLNMVAAAATSAYANISEDMKAVFAPFAPPLSEAEIILRDLGIAYEKKRDNTLIVPGDVDLSNRGLAALPDLSRVVVKGSFRCDGNELISLAGAPKSVGRDFWCQGNMLTSLAGIPGVLAGSLHCEDNLLTSLDGVYNVGEEIFCGDNLLPDLETAPEKFGKLNSDFGSFASWKDAVSPPHVQRARELFRRLSAGDTGGFPSETEMARKIRLELSNVREDLGALDPEGKRPAAEMEKALRGILAAGQVKTARELYARLSAGDTEGFRTIYMMDGEIRDCLRKADAGLEALDASGKTSASDMAKNLNDTVQALELKRGRALYVRLLAGDTEGFRSPENMASDIRDHAKRSTAGLAALDAEGKGAEGEVEEKLKDATAAPHLKTARTLSARLLAGDTAGFRSAPVMLRDIRSEIRLAGTDAAALDPSGAKSAGDMDKTLEEAAQAAQLQCARKLFARFLAGDREGYSSAEEMAQEIQYNVESAKAPLASLDAEGKSSDAQVAAKLKETVAAPHVRKAVEMFVQLTTGDLSAVSPEYMAKDIRAELKRAGAGLEVLDATGKNTAEQMEQVLSEAALAGHLKRAAGAYERLLAGDATGHYSPEVMVKAIRADLKSAQAEVPALDPSGKATAEEIEKILSAAVPACHLKTARNLYARLLGKAPAGKDPDEDSSPKDLSERLRDSLEEAGEGLAALEPGAGKTDAQVDRIIKDIVAAVHIKRARELFNRISAGDTEGFSLPVSMAHAILKELNEVKADLTALDPSGGKSAKDIDRFLKATSRTPARAAVPAAA